MSENFSKRFLHSKLVGMIVIVATVLSCAGCSDGNTPTSAVSKTEDPNGSIVSQTDNEIVRSDISGLQFCDSKKFWEQFGTFNYTYTDDKVDIKSDFDELACLDKAVQRNILELTDKAIALTDEKINFCDGFKVIGLSSDMTDEELEQFKTDEKNYLKFDWSEDTRWFPVDKNYLGFDDADSIYKTVTEVYTGRTAEDFKNTTMAYVPGYFALPDYNSNKFYIDEYYLFTTKEPYKVYDRYCIALYDDESKKSLSCYVLTENTDTEKKGSYAIRKIPFRYENNRLRIVAVHNKQYYASGSFDIVNSTMSDYGYDYSKFENEISDVDLTLVNDMSENTREVTDNGVEPAPKKNIENFMGTFPDSITYNGNEYLLCDTEENYWMDRNFYYNGCDAEETVADGYIARIYEIKDKNYDILLQSDALFNINGYYLTDKEVIANVICRENCVYDGGVFVDSKVKPYMKKAFAEQIEKEYTDSRYGITAGMAYRSFNAPQEEKWANVAKTDKLILCDKNGKPYCNETKSVLTIDNIVLKYIEYADADAVPEDPNDESERKLVYIRDVVELTTDSAGRIIKTSLGLSDESGESTLIYFGYLLMPVECDEYGEITLFNIYKVTPDGIEFIKEYSGAAFQNIYFDDTMHR